jgi:hypothetical protein
MHRTGSVFFEGKVLPRDLFFSIAPIVLGQYSPSLISLYEHSKDKYAGYS